MIIGKTVNLRLYDETVTKWAVFMPSAIPAVQALLMVDVMAA